MQFRILIMVLAAFLIVGPTRSQNSVPPVSPSSVPLGAGETPQAEPPAQIPMPPPLSIPPPQPPAPPPAQVMPFPKLPAVTLDMTGDSLGIAQQTARTQNLQGRLLWVDATANLGDINTGDKIQALVTKAVQTGFNVIVLDSKPLIGYTIYPSEYAPKLVDWNGGKAVMAAGFDPLAEFVKDAHAAGIQLVANVAPFGEGHKYFQKGPGYTNPSWQTILYEPSRTVRAPVLYSQSFQIDNTVNEIPIDPLQIGVYNEPSMLHKQIPNAMAEVVDFTGKVMAQIDGNALDEVELSVPPGGAILVAKGPAGAFMRNSTHVGDVLMYDSQPKYVPVSQADEQKITVFANPVDPVVQQHEFDIIREIVTKYPVDGIICDDRTRFAALNADFSPVTMKAFETYVGHPLKWPDDVFRYSPYPNQDIIKGPEYEAWLVFRALTIRNWVADARAIVKAVRPNATFSVYVGSWYGEYDGNGENWAADDSNVGFSFETPSFRKTGFAGLLDWITTGCYYKVPTIDEGQKAGNAGATVEAAGQLSNRLVNDQTWTYAGLYMAQFQDQPEELAKCLQAAAASTQGVMIFDTSQVNQFNLWPVLASAFATPALAPHTVPGLIDTVRANHASAAASAASSATTVLPGTPGTGL